MKSEFLDLLELSNVVPVPKKDPNDKTNYRLISLLPLPSKVLFESPTFCKAHSNQHALFKLIQSLKIEPDNSGLVRAILMRLLKTCD